MKSTKKGFTLVELIVVIAIIGILAALLVPSMMDYTKKARLKQVNSNAKLVFNTINARVAELNADGKLDDISAGTVSGYVKNMSAETDATDPVKTAVYKALSDNGGGSGYTAWCIASDKSIEWAQWATGNSDNVVVGQYPDPEDNVEATHEIGSKF